MAGTSIQAQREARKALQVMQKQLAKDIRETQKVLKKLPKEFRGRVRQKVLEEAAEPLVQAAKAKAPVSDTDHFDYNAKAGKRKTKYYSGNLQKSIRVIKRRRSYSVWVGPKVQRKAKAKAYGRNERNVNAFYASFVEFGTSKTAPSPYMRPALDASKGKVLSIARRKFERIVKLYELRNKK